MELDLAENLMGEQPLTVIQNRRGALIARGFNCQNAHVAVESCAPVPMGPAGRGLFPLKIK
jgi:hypothetical protein